MSGAPKGGAGLSVDVVINNYEYGRFLAAAIESALAQDHPAREVIVVDDGSTDESRAVIERYADRVTVVLKENGGQASAMNAGFELCRGDVVVFLDSDDVLEPGALARVAAAFAADPALVKVQSRSRVIDVEGRPTGTLKPDAHLEMPDGDLRRAELTQPFDLVWMSTSANAFRRSALSTIMPIPEPPFRSCADWYLVHLTALLGPVRSLPEVGVGYRLHGANNYEPQAADLDLGHIRETIQYAAVMAPLLLDLATRLGLRRPDRILSVADLGNRIVSLRLAPELHPIAGDTRAGLLADAVRALRRREGAGAAMKAMFLGWFAAMAVLPAPLTRPLAERYLFPARRTGLNRLLGRLHRDRVDG